MFRRRYQKQPKITNNKNQNKKKKNKAKNFCNHGCLKERFI